MFRSTYLSLFFLFLSVVLSVKFEPIDDVQWPPKDLTINTKYGPVKGYSSDGADIWHGIPFAKPPTGANRFKPPQAPTPWTSAIDCSEHSPICPQLDIKNRRTIGQEDCLYLDIYRPAGATGPLPVMFWIYGGGFVVGDSYEFGTYDGINRVNDHPIILVNINYRLNAFGFLALEELRNESGSLGTSGNYAVQDQRFALKWVQENIAQFGGDPKQVTIYGESAGAFSVCYHVSSSASKGLFRSAIMESGTCDAKEFFIDFQLADSWSADVAAWTGCNRTTLSHDAFMSCLRSTPAVDWMSTVLSWFTGKWDQSGTGYRPLLAPLMPWGIAIDGAEQGLKGVPLELIKQKQGSQIPLIAGTNSDEGSIFIPALPLIVPDVKFPISESDVNLTLQHFFDIPTTNSILAHYPLQEFSDAAEQTAIILRDYIFVCPTRRLHRAVHNNSLHSWQYHFTYKYRHPIEYKDLGDFHTSEMKYVWDNFRAHETFQDGDMVDTFGYYWTNLGINQDPNKAPKTDPDQITWPTYDPSTDNFINMTVPCTITTYYFTFICDFWDTIYPN